MQHNGLIAGQPNEKKEAWWCMHSKKRISEFSALMRVSGVLVGRLFVLDMRLLAPNVSNIGISRETEERDQHGKKGLVSQFTRIVLFG